MSDDQLYQFVLYRSRRPLEVFVSSTQRFMAQYQSLGAGPVQLLQKVGGASRFDYLTISKWKTEDFYKAFKNGHMPMGSARIEQAGGYFMVDEKGDPGEPAPDQTRLYLGFEADLTEDMVKPLMEKVDQWRIFKGVARNSFYTFIWEGVVDIHAPELEGIAARDQGAYKAAGIF